jgi:pimeloyl-ACP methyl ester carboxylesterase
MEAYKTDKEQKKKSRYIGFFKLPYLPEWYFSFNNYSKLVDLWSESSEKQIDIYLEIFSKKRVLKSALNWYRANVGKITPEVSPQLGDVYVPTLLLWGKNDAAIGRKGVEGTDKYMRGPYELMELEAGHWLIQEAFQDVSKAIVNHIETYSLHPEN